ncbi:D-alanine--D-alanine ligase [Thermoleophilia bacterium SCSIO 60948]|nr:D-alanine--D-alanine ligase [Thermoleophilia bacterium SCSIO 60948]
MALRLLHLTGSAESEFFAELSRLYAGDCLAEIDDPARYESLVAHVDPGGEWRFPEDLSPAALERAEPLGAGAAVARIGDERPDVMVPQMFCLPGMTAYRSLFEVLGIPYLGSRGDVMAIAADKARTRSIVAAAGVAVPDAEVVRPGQRPGLDPPYVVKPLASDNSTGVSLVRDAHEVEDALERALAVGPAALVERYVELGREVRCGLLARGDELDELPLEEYALDPEAHPIRGEADKLARDGEQGGLRLVAKDSPGAWIIPRSDPVCEPAWEASRRAHRALGCRDYSLFDFRIDPDGRPWFLEAGPYCSFARTSVIATMARAEGTGVAELFAEAVAQAMSRTNRGAAT